MFKGQSLSLKIIIDEILQYKLIGYAWYVQTYAWIYLFFPLVNMFIRLFNEKNKWMFEIILIISILVIGLPPLLINLPHFQILHLPINIHLIYRLCPFVYYLIGAYLRKFLPTIKLSILFTFEFLIIIGSIVFNIIKRNPYVGGAEGNYPSIVVILQALFFFMIIMQLFDKKVKIVNAISKRTLSVYLLSFSIDQILYPFLIWHVTTAKNLIMFMPLVGATVFIISFVLSFLAEWITDIIWPWLYRILQLPEVGFKKVFLATR